MIRLKTTDEVIALFGEAEILRLTGRRAVNAPRMWKMSQRGKFPADTYVLLTKKLAKLNATAPDSLWGMVEEPVTPRRSPGKARTKPDPAARSAAE
jgi:hypothetical protein